MKEWIWAIAFLAGLGLLIGASAGSGSAAMLCAGAVLSAAGVLGLRKAAQKKDAGPLAAWIREILEALGN